MRKIFSILIILIFFKQSYALECKACEATDSDATCELTYECDKGSKYCETLVSKVEGSYSVVMSCSTEEKCDAKAILKDGLDECDHDDDNTECYSCCKGDSCNTLESALEKLPEDIFENEKPVKKGKKSKGKKVNDEDESADEDETDENTDKSDDEEYEVEEKKGEKKKSKDKKSKNKEEKPDDKEEIDDENPEEPEEEDPEKEESEKETINAKKADETLASSNATVEVVNESPENGTVIQKSADNSTVVVTNTTSNGTEEGTANNNEILEVLEPLDPNIQAIEKKLNETGVIVEDLAENLENAVNAGNAENVENTAAIPENVDPKTLDENSANNAEMMEENKVENGIEFNAPENPEDDLAPGNEGNAENSETGDSNIITQGENANEAGEQHELFDTPSSSRKYQISEILLSAVLILVLVQLF